MAKAKLSKGTIWIDDLLGTNVENALGAWTSGMVLAGWAFKQYSTKSENGPAKIRLALASASSEQVRHVRGDEGVAIRKDGRCARDSMRNNRELGVFGLLGRERR